MLSYDLYILSRMILLLEKQQQYFKQLNRWFLSEPGFHIAEAFAQECLLFSDKLRGSTLLQLGLCGKNPWLQAMSFQKQWIVSPFETQQTALVSSLSQLPLDRRTLDCVLSPLSLDAFSISKPLDELDRILKPAGHIVFFGINPVSLWGLWFRYSKQSCFGASKQWPKSVIALKQAMMHRGYVQIHLSSFYYIPPFSSTKWLTRFEVFNEIGKMMSPMPSAFYCLVMQKCVLSPLKLKPSQLTEAIATG